MVGLSDFIGIHYQKTPGVLGLSWELRLDKQGVYSVIQAIQQKVHVQADGRLEIVANGLQAGMEADVIVLVQSPQYSMGGQTETEEPANARLEATTESSVTIAQAQEIVRRYIPEGHSLVDELISERRVGWFAR